MSGKVRKGNRSPPFLKIKLQRGTWMAQSVKHLTLGFGSVDDLRVVGWSLVWGSVLSGESA